MREADSSISVNRGDDDESRPSLIFSFRFLLSIMLFFGVGVQYMQKIDMGIGIVCMVNNTAIKSSELPFFKNDSGSNDTCMFKPTHGNHTDGPFAWSKQVQGFILSSYFYGYILTQVVSGWLSLVYGGKIVVALSMLFGSIGTMLVSESARVGYGLLIVCRFITGLAHGAVWPAISALYVNWAPPLEKSRMIGFSTSGVNIGNIAALVLGSYLCVHGFDGGWSSIFYIFGLIGVVWFVLFMLLTSESPQTHKFIGARERKYIIEKTKVGSLENKARPKFSDTPWRKIFRSKPCIAIFISHFCSNWSNYLFLTQLPSYMNEVLRFDIKSNGLVSSIPYVTSMCIAGTSSLIADKLITSNVLSRTNVRKLFNGLGLFVPCIAVTSLSFVTCSNPYLAVAFLAIGLGFIGCSSGSGFVVNINEVGGKYAGILFGISNTVGTLPGIIAPYIVGLITVHRHFGHGILLKKEQKEWQTVFWLTAVVNLIGGIFYTFMCSAEVENWAKEETDLSESLVD